MEIELAEMIVAACGQNGVRAEVKEDYSASWMRGRKTAGVVIQGGDLTQVVSAVVANAHLFVEGDAPKFDLKQQLSVSPFRLSLILY